MRKLSSLRSIYHYLFKNELINADVTLLVDMPKRHEKPIIRLEVDEVARLLDLVESGEKQTQHQKRYNDHTRLRDLAILTLFLGTGIRVSELVGIDIDDLDFEVGGFMVTRKGGGQAILYFPDEVASVLKDYLRVRRAMAPLPGHENALFLSLQNRRIFRARRATDGQEVRHAGCAAEKALESAQAALHLRHQSLPGDRRYLSRRRCARARGRQHHPPALCRHG